jgi:hypothetical protein
MLKMNLDVTSSSICPSLEQKPTRNIQLKQMLAQVGFPIFMDAYIYRYLHQTWRLSGESYTPIPIILSFCYLPQWDIKSELLSLVWSHRWIVSTTKGPYHGNPSGIWDGHLSLGWVEGIEDLSRFKN